MDGCNRWLTNRGASVSDLFATTGLGNFCTATLGPTGAIPAHPARAAAKTPSTNRLRSDLTVTDRQEAEPHRTGLEVCIRINDLSY